MKSIIYFLTVLLVVTGCKNANENPFVNEKVQANSLADAKMAAVAEEDAEPAHAATAKQGLISQKIIKEGNIRFETNDLQLTYKKIIDVANKKQCCSSK
ncbi:MAG: hypothetical protein H7174_03775 [Flavobacterium sp.]|nr:hypothetical protein [Flavobacterium sp.]